MLRRSMLALLLALMFGASVSQGGWNMQIHKGPTVEEHALAEIDSLTFASQGEWKMQIHKGAIIEEDTLAEIDSITYNETLAPPMVLVPAGVFIMGDGVAPSCGVQEHQVTLTHPFYLGQYEVTNQEYRDALQWAYDQTPRLVTAMSSSVYDNLDGSTVLLVNLANTYCEVSFSGGSFTVDPGKEDYPLVAVSWYGAAAYCDWLSMQAGLTRAYNHLTWECNGGNPYTATGYRLPTDAEWEYAAQYDDERDYPWGNGAPDCTRANYKPSSYCVGGTSPVGSYPAAPASLGLYDMAGNVWEWCNDWFICNLGTDNQTDPVGSGWGSSRVLRGGSWSNPVYSLRCSYRNSLGPSYPDPYSVGFRCVRSQ